MSRGVNTQGGRKGRRGRRVWFIGAAILVAALLYLEQTALLYVLSTLALCGLLLVVAFADLEGRDKEMTEETRQEQAAAAGGGETKTAAASRPARRVAKRGRHEAA